MIGRMGAPSVSVMLKSWDIRVGTTGEMVLDAARQAEALGLDGIIAGDHVTFYGYGNDGLITLTAGSLSRPLIRRPERRTDLCMSWAA